MNVFLVHGSFGSPFSNWIPWLSSELEKRDIPFLAPHFPTPEHQDYESWAKLLDFYYSVGKADEETVFVTHSVGCIFIAHYLAINNKKALGLIACSGYNEFHDDPTPMYALNKPFYIESERLACLKENVKVRINYVGDNDPYINRKYFEKYSNGTFSEMRLIHNGGHLNADAQLLEDILKIK